MPKISLCDTAGDDKIIILERTVIWDVTSVFKNQCKN